MIMNSEQHLYLAPKVKVITLNARHSILLDLSNTGSNKNEQVGDADGFGDDFWG